jgi:hypothetical protein
MPLPAHTKVLAIRELVAQKLDMDFGNIHIIQKSGRLGIRMMRDTEENVSRMWVKGIKSWERPVKRYSHPMCLVGAGHSSLRMALALQHCGYTDMCIFDPHDRVGGRAWVANANKTSKLQTEFGNYHLKFHPDWAAPICHKSQPSAAELLDHFQSVMDEFGLLPAFHPNTFVSNMVVNKQKDNYTCTIDKIDPKDFKHGQVKQELLDGEPSETTGDILQDSERIEVSAIAVHPGGLVAPRRVEYRGEDIFEGQIGYGMFNEFDYSKVKGQSVAIIGMGAFGTENVRTCVEHSAGQVYIICRRKSLPMPRICSWFINQAIFPVPGVMCMDMMQPMYNLSNEDPWTYYSVFANSQRTTVTIRQKSRFGIGEYQEHLRISV